MNESDSCLGVIGLSLSATLIAIIQLIYSAMSLILILTTNDALNPMTDLHSITMSEVLVYAIGFIAACILGVGSLM